MTNTQNNIASFALIGCVLTFACASTPVEAGKQTCQEKCQTVWSPKLQACKEVEQCVEYVQQQYNTCLRHCKE